GRDDMLGRTVLDRKLREQRGGYFTFGAFVDAAEARHRAQVRQHQVLADGTVRQDTLLFAIRGQKADALGERIRRTDRAKRGAGKADRAAADRMKPDERAPHLLTAAADDAVKTDNLAVIDVKGYVRAAGLQADNIEQRRTARGDRRRRLQARRSPDQKLDQLFFSRFAGDRAIGDNPALAHDADMVGDFQHLAQVVRDVKNCGACVAQALGHGKKLFDLAAREARGTLVETANFGWCARALPISSICLCALPSRRTGRHRSSARPSWSSIALPAPSSPRRSNKAGIRNERSRPRNKLSTTSRSGASDSS